MAKLYVHGHPVIDYVRKRTGREVGPTRADNEYEERVYRSYVRWQAIDAIRQRLASQELRW